MTAIAMGTAVAAAKSVQPTVQRLRIFTAGLSLVSVIVTIITAFVRPDEALSVVFPALGIFLVMTVPIYATRSIDAFAPWAYLMYWIYVDVFLRALYIAFDSPNEATINIIFLLGKSKDFLLFPGFVMLVGCMFVCAGYLSKGRAAEELPTRFEDRQPWNERRFKIAIAGLLLVSWVGLIQFVIATLGDLTALIAASLSAYRGLSDDLTEYRAYGWLRAMVSMSDLAFYMTLTAIMTTRKSPLWVKLACLTAFMTSAAFYAFTQSRSGVMVLFIYGMVLRYYFGGRKLPVRILPIVVPLLLGIFFTLTTLRRGSGFAAQSVQEFSPTMLLEPFVVNNGGVDVSKTGHIIDHYGPKLDLSVGKTYLWLFIAWIPRQFWPQKPPNIDTEIGMTIYGAITYGTGAVPPGLFGELFLNFWYLGIPVGCWILGRAMRAINTRFIVHPSGRNSVIIYVMFFMATGLSVLGSSFVSFVAGVLVQLLPLLIVLRFITEKQPKVNPTGAATP